MTHALESFYVQEVEPHWRSSTSVLCHEARNIMFIDVFDSHLASSTVYFNLLSLDNALQRTEQNDYMYSKWDVVEKAIRLLPGWVSAHLVKHLHNAISELYRRVGKPW